MKMSCEKEDTVVSDFIEPLRPRISNGPMQHRYRGISRGVLNSFAF